MKTIFTIIFISAFSLMYSQDITGTYLVNGKSNAKILISKLDGDIYKVDSRNEKWKASGLFYNENGSNTLMLIYKYDNVKNKNNYRGIQSAVLQPNGNFKVSIRHWRDAWNKPKTEIHTVVWIKQ